MPIMLGGPKFRIPIPEVAEEKAPEPTTAAVATIMQMRVTPPGEPYNEPPQFEDLTHGQSETRKFKALCFGILGCIIATMGSTQLVDLGATITIGGMVLGYMFRKVRD